MEKTQLELAIASSRTSKSEKKRSGPPNRMNDLAYRDWMKFQKSFFRFESDQRLVEQCIHFFTKATWPSGHASRSLIVGFEAFAKSGIDAPRDVVADADVASAEALVKIAADAAEEEQQYDFALFDLRTLITNRRALSAFLSQHADSFFKSLRDLMAPNRYCGIVVGTEEQGGGGFPLPWSIAAASRKHLKLRDEKVGLVEEEKRVVYVLFMQAAEDEKVGDGLLPAQVSLSEHPEPIPGWTIPRPPPRKYGEVLHPAKYPETLVTEFIERFTAPGARVFDPMVGTGSTVVAATRVDRHGYGVDLNEAFVNIARRRVEVANTPSLFGEVSDTLIVRGDATKLSRIREMDGLMFDYAITSPPYWSMLSNPGSENQKARRARDLQLTYSEDEQDLGNVREYERFLDLLETVYREVARKLTSRGMLTVVVKNVKRDHVLYPLAWDLAARLCSETGDYDYAGTTLWCQDNVGLKPFAVGIHWVSNILHQYCLHFRKRG